MTTDDATGPQDGASDHPDPDLPVPFSEALERIRTVARRILERVKKATEDTDLDVAALPPCDAPTVEQPLLPPPPA